MRLGKPKLNDTLLTLKIPIITKTAMKFHAWTRMQTMGAYAREAIDFFNSKCDNEPGTPEQIKRAEKFLSKNRELLKKVESEVIQHATQKAKNQRQEEEITQ